MTFMAPAPAATAARPAAPSNPGSVGVVILTRNSRRHLEHCLGPVLASPLKPKILIVDSASSDGTVEAAEKYPVEIARLPQSHFNHGATREAARRRIGTEIVVMMTHDAYPSSPRFLEPLVEPIQEGIAAVSYARQLPQRGAGFFEAFPRSFNYPPQSQLRALEDVDRYGSFTFFCSNSCAAWSTRALDEVGGFPVTLVTEDSIAAARLLLAGYRIAYVAESTVHHSHAYSLVEEFKRYFDIGYVRERFKDVLLARHMDEGHGSRFARALLSELFRTRPMLLPYGVAQIAAKYAGYKAGRVGARLPSSFCRMLSGQDYYWNSIYAPGRAQRELQ
jgi:rhamnosyltransferase